MPDAVASQEIQPGNTGKRALITGITGQDGSYLAEFLLAKGYEVHGIVRRVALEDPEHRLKRLGRIRSQINLHAASLRELCQHHQVVGKVLPDECYHLAAQSFVSYSFDDEFSTLNANINGTHFLLAALKNLAPRCRFYFAGSSEMFGHADEVPQTERTRFHPRSKLRDQQSGGIRSDAQLPGGVWDARSSGILFNHESPRRGYEFVTRKITSGVARIAAGSSKELRLGNLEAKRDWGHAREYVEAMWLMLQQARTGRLRDRHRGNPLGARVCGAGVCARGPGLPRPCGPGSGLVPPGGGPRLAGRCQQSEEEAGVEAPRPDLKRWCVRWWRPIAGPWGSRRQPNRAPVEALGISGSLAAFVRSPRRL